MVSACHPSKLTGKQQELAYSQPKINGSSELNGNRRLSRSHEGILGLHRVTIQKLNLPTNGDGIKGEPESGQITISRRFNDRQVKMKLWAACWLCFAALVKGVPLELTGKIEFIGPLPSLKPSH